MHWPALLCVHFDLGPVPSPFVISGIALILPGLSNADIGPFRIVEVRVGILAISLRVRLSHIEAKFPLHGYRAHLPVGIGDARGPVSISTIGLGFKTLT